MVPKTIGRYEIQAELGRGGMSTVYLAHDPHFERDVAVKLLPVELAYHSTFRRRFEREAKVVAALADPAIVPVYDFGEEKGQPYLVMRFMTGGSLAERLHQGALSLAEAAHIMTRLAPALDEVHAHKVIHRDLKPSNILFDQRSEPYISDFGTVKMTKATTQLTDTGGAVGTPAYMSPEQIQGMVELDGRSDIYTLGIILYEMLSGKHPFQSNTPIAIAVKHMFEPTPRLLDSRPDLPPEIQTILNKAMAKLPDDRYETAVAFAQAISSLVAPPEIDEVANVVVETTESHGRRLALIVSSSEYHDPTLAHLVKPTANVHRLVDVLRNPAIGGFDQVATVIDESADAIRRSLAHFLADRTKEDMVLLYFMGHAVIGAEDKLYLAAKDTERNLLRGTAIPAAYLAEIMDESQCWQQIVIFDCTFSNASSRDSQELVGKVVNTDDSFNRNGHERVILSASDRAHYEWAKDTITGSALPSLFTHYFVEGLKTGAADNDHNGKVTVDELFAYINGQLARKTSAMNGARPSKWASFAYQGRNHIVIATNPQMTPVVPTAPSQPKASRMMRPRTWAVMGTAVALLILILFGGSWVKALQTATPTAQALVLLPTATPSATTPPTTTRSTVKATAVPTQTASPTATNTVVSTATATPTASPPPVSNTLAIVQLASSVFDAPDTAAQELTFIGIGDAVQVMGRSDNGEWLFVQNEEGIQGFVHAPRVSWAGDLSLLPVMGTAVTTTTSVPATPSSDAVCQGSSCPELTLDIYPLTGSRCENGLYYRTVYMQGRGGDGRYTYYWNNEKLTGPLTNEGFGFEVSSTDREAVIGVGKISSGDGQTIEKDLFVTDFGCE